MCAVKLCVAVHVKWCVAVPVKLCVSVPVCVCLCLCACVSLRTHREVVALDPQLLRLAHRRKHVEPAVARLPHTPPQSAAKCPRRCARQHLPNMLPTLLGVAYIAGSYLQQARIAHIAQFGTWQAAQISSCLSITRAPSSSRPKVSTTRPRRIREDHAHTRGDAKAEESHEWTVHGAAKNMEGDKSKESNGANTERVARPIALLRRLMQKRQRLVVKGPQAMVKG
eukprot:244970-Rhodomonas_salina.1